MLRDAATALVAARRNRLSGRKLEGDLASVRNRAGTMPRRVRPLGQCPSGVVAPAKLAVGTINSTETTVASP
jgi:hypothetical protein